MGYDQRRHDVIFDGIPISAFSCEHILLCTHWLQPEHEQGLNSSVCTHMPSKTRVNIENKRNTCAGEMSMFFVLYCVFLCFSHENVFDLKTVTTRCRPLTRAMLLPL